MTTDIQITNTYQGNALIAKILSGTPITFTRMSIGEGYCAGELKAVTGLTNKLFDVDITSKEATTIIPDEPEAPQSYNAMILCGSFDGSQYERDFYYREVGFWALDPDTQQEILFAYGNFDDEADFIKARAPETTTQVQERTDIEAVIYVGNAKNIEVIINANLENCQLRAEKGQPEGYAPLDESGKVPKEHLPATVTNTRFAILSANTNASGLPDLASFSGKTVTFKAGGDYPILKATDAQGAPFELEGISQYDANVTAFKSSVPVMTSNTLPEGAATYTGTVYSGEQPWTLWRPSPGLFSWSSAIGTNTYTYDEAHRPRAGKKAKVSFSVDTDITGRTLNNIAVTLTYADDTTKTFNFGNAAPVGNAAPLNYETPVFVLEKDVKSITFAHSGSTVNLVTARFGNAKFLVEDPQGALYLSDEQFSLFVNKMGDVTQGQLYKQAFAPTEPQDGDIWVNTCLNAFNEYKSGAWVEATKIPIALVKAQNGAIVDIYTHPYNDNGAPTNRDTLIKNNIPDYSRSVNMTLPPQGSTFTVPCDSEIRVVCEGNTVTNIALKLDNSSGPMILRAAVGSNVFVSTDKVILSAGTVVYVQANTGTSYSALRTPLKGAI